MYIYIYIYTLCICICTHIYIYIYIYIYCHPVVADGAVGRQPSEAPPSPATLRVRVCVMCVCVRVPPLLLLLIIMKIMKIIIIIIIIIIILRRWHGERVCFGQLGSTLMGQLQKQDILTDYGERGTPWYFWERKSRLTGVPKRSLCQNTSNLQ